MSVHNWLVLGAGIWFAASVLVILLVYTCFAIQIIPAEPDSQEADHQPELDDEMLYLTASMYPYHELMHYIGPLPIGQQPAAKPAA